MLGNAWQHIVAIPRCDVNMSALDYDCHVTVSCSEWGKNVGKIRGCGAVHST